MNPFISKLLDIVFPRRCKGCGCYVKDGNKNFVCAACWSDISIINSSCCAICGIPFTLKKFIPEKYICSQCRKKRPYFDSVISFAVYDGTIKELIHNFKYNKKMGIFNDLFHLISDLPDRLSDANIDFVAHIPLHKQRLRHRGFDQSFILAQKIHNHFNIPLVSDNLKRIKKTANQIGLTKKGRAANIKGAFIVKHPEKFKGKKILLVDDVLTTGATANECSKMLKKSGAKEINILTLARTVLKLH